jgi:hypothetical protein
METTSVGTEYPEQQERCRDLLLIYRSLGAPGAFGAVVIEATLREADEAAISGDIVRQLAAFKRMQELE